MVYGLDSDSIIKQKKKKTLVSNCIGLLFTDEDHPTARGYVFFVDYSTHLQKCSHDRR
jgi:hypothetical protein